MGALELRTALCTKFAIELPATAVFDFPTPEALSGLITSRLAALSPALHEGASIQTISQAASQSAAARNRSDSAVPRPGRTRQRRVMRMQPAQDAAGQSPGQQAMEATQALILRLVQSILGVSVAPQQPLMEARPASVCTTLVHVATSICMLIQHESSPTQVSCLCHLSSA